MRITLKKRLTPLAWKRHLLAPSSILVALTFGGLLFLLVGANPFRAYGEVFLGAFGSLDNFSEVLVRATPIIFCGLSVGLAVLSMIIFFFIPLVILLDFFRRDNNHGFHVDVNQFIE